MVKWTLRFGTLLLALLGFEPVRAGDSAREIDFAREIRPLLADHCFHCHGNDEGSRKAHLRLDTAEGLFSRHEDSFPVVPGKLAESEIWKRVTSTDPDEVMPPPKAHHTLTSSELEKLRRWIEGGAPYREHWAFRAPVRPELPRVEESGWPRNPVDAFLLTKLEAEHLKPSPDAPKELLLRRVTFDLTGLPPTPAEVDAFLTDDSPGAYERVVDRLLVSPRFGERMARPWLDAVRYGDTQGMHYDDERSIWPYRDWVVRAFNENLPFDQFTIWQIAGDLLPQATRDQLIASGYNRCNLTTNEAGSVEAELLHRYALDRTTTTVSLWMGLTAECAVCHDHKFDPLSQKEFYSLYAFFHSAAEPAMEEHAQPTPPVLRLTTPEQEKREQEMAAESAKIEAEMKSDLASLPYRDPALQSPRPAPAQVETVWMDDEFPARTPSATVGPPAQWVTSEAGVKVWSGERALRRTAEGIGQDSFERLRHPYAVPANGKLFAYVWLDPADPPKALMLQWHSEHGWRWRANWGDPGAIPYGHAGTPEKLQMGPLPTTGEWVRLEVDVKSLRLPPGQQFDGLAFTQYGGTVCWDFAGVAFEDDTASDPLRSQTLWERGNQWKELGDPVPKRIQLLFRAVEPKSRRPDQTAALRKYYLTEVCSATAPHFAAMSRRLATLKESSKKEEAEVVKTLVMHDVAPPRPTFVLQRGQYDKPGDPVQPGVPAILPPLPSPAHATRLDLAQWLFLPEQPLTARVAVNRFWQLFFGTGLVKTMNDFGTQGEPPSHPQLLDWLAVDFREHGWDVKRLVRLLVTSAAYRQDSRATPELREADPDNRLLARGPRFRLEAEEIRDNALFVSGLMDFTMGGKGVKPYQPERVWEPVGFIGSNTREYHQDHGAALYRRSLYTFWKRTAPPPSMAVFDAPSREQACPRRERSDTPLQALATLNDVQQVEAARALGQRMLLEAAPATDARLDYGFRLVTARFPREGERKILRTLLERELSRYAGDPAAAAQIVAIGESKPDDSLLPSELAAYTQVASAMLNLDETLNRN